MKDWLRVVNILAILVVSSMAVSAASTNESIISLKLSGANPISIETPLSQSKTPSYYFSQDYQAKMQLPIPPRPKSFYRNIYPGIDLTCYGDEHQLEYIFTVLPGADPSMIRLLFEGIQSVSMTHTGGIRIIIPGGEIIQNAPVVFIESADKSYRADGRYEMSYDSAVTINPGELFSKKASKINNTRFNLVPAGGQPGGPDYDFYLSKFEITNDQFLRFLNDAEANNSTVRGSNMFFDKLGNVWINPQMKRGSDEMFEMAGSQLSYDADKPAGSRYSHRQKKDGKTPYASHPVTSASWFGAIKYCNWLTIEAGRNPAECCYTEGTNTFDWAPVTATNWAKGYFSDAERQAWLSLKGFRLPMLNCSADSITTNNFNEFYKAASWGATTNRLFGYGRDSFDGTEANYRNTFGGINQRTFPVGYFDGNEYLGAKRTRPNENFYGIFDLSGNVNEWMNDFGTNRNPEYRIVCGGSWEDPSTPLTRGKAVPTYSTSTFGGLRTTTTYLPLESLRIHVLYSFFMEELPVRQPTTAEEIAAFAAMAMIPPESPQPEEIQTSGKPGGPKMDILAPRRRSDITMPDGITYKPGVLDQPVPTLVPGQQPSEPGGTVMPPPPSFEAAKPSIPPAIPTRFLTVRSTNPNSGLLINVNPADYGGNTAGNTQFIFTYPIGTTVNLIAPIDSGSSIFDQWLRDGVFFSATNAITVVLNTNITMTAAYNTYYQLQVHSTDPNSGVPVDINPADINGNTDGNTWFNRIYYPGALVTLTAPTNSGTAIFVEWLRLGVFYTASSVANIAMVRNITMTARYVLSTTEYTLIVRSSSPLSGANITVNPIDNNGDGNGTTVFSRLYTVGSYVTVVAAPTAGGNFFQRWQLDGVDVTTNLTTTVYMDNNRIITAVYVHIPGPIDPPPISPGGV